MHGLPAAGLERSIRAVKPQHRLGTKHVLSDRGRKLKKNKTPISLDASPPPPNHGDRALFTHGIRDDVPKHQRRRRRRLLLDVPRRGAEVVVRAGPGGEDGGVALHGRVEGVKVGGRDGVGEGDEAVGVEGAEGALEGLRGEGFGGELGGGEGDEDGAV